MQALDVAGNRSDVFIAQLACDGAHGHRVAVIGATTVFLAEVGQLLGDVLSVLATQMREACCSVAGTIWRMAAGAGWQTFFQVAATEQRFTASDESLRPMGRSTEGVKGMSFRAGDSLLSASVAREGAYVFVVTDGGYAKRTDIAQYRSQSRGGLGIKVARLSDDRGVLAGGLMVAEDDEVLVVLASGKVVRSAVAEVPAKGRDTMGVVFARTDEADRIIAIARNSERGLTETSDAAEAAAAEALDPEQPGTEQPDTAQNDAGSAAADASPEIPEESTDA